MSLYNAKSTDQPDTYLFTKFDDDLNIVDDSVYLTSIAECTCPAGARSSCRHRQMLPMFLVTGRIDTDYFYCFETSDWSHPFTPLDDSEDVTQADIDAAQQAPDNPPTDQDWDQLTIKLVAPIAVTAGPDEASAVRELDDSEVDSIDKLGPLEIGDKIVMRSEPGKTRTFRRL